MTILGFILVFVMVGVVLWLINRYVPMQAEIKTLMNVAVVIVLVIWLISTLGLLGPLNVPIRVRP